ncbi:selenide, water dikinase SelD [Vulcanococcus limneticus]|uniref:selenide, water dikinase SelD n=1 Tax=Vulcanococcus limneticus TaxID=2170428 RepID=UPI00398BBE25
MRPRLRPAHTLVTLVSRQSTAVYSGTLPALVAGLIAAEESAIDLRRLCALAGVTFLRAEIVGLDPVARELRLEGRPPLRFDRLSLDVGAVTAGGSTEPDAAPRLGPEPDGPMPYPSGTGGTKPTGNRAWGDSGQPVKPLEPFLAWLSTLTRGSALRIRGGGAAAVELALALRARGYGPRLLLRGQGLRLGSAAANRLGERLLAEAGIPLERNVPQAAPADLACTGSRAPAWLAAAGLPVDAATGRVVTTASLQVLEHPHLFAAGDCAVVAGAPRPASGVWAVRATPVLATNLQRSLEQPQRRLRRWRSQRRALQLLGDGGWSPKGPRAVVFWGPVALGPSRWLWRWKRHLDQRFLEGFAALAPMGPEAMACRGCAAKLAAAPLEGALARLEGMARAQAPSHSAPALNEGRDGVEDAAVLATAADGSLLLQSVDGFPALVADPWLNARLTTLHACGDLWASGADLESVQALVTLPEAEPALQEELLLQTLAGVRSVLDPLGARLIGGHTLEGRDGAGLALALTVNGRVDPGRHWLKGPLREGDALLLSGPLGSGVLFAAAMAGAARPGWIDAALQTMQRSPARLVELLAAHGCHACTDVTGFGLLGHLGEMLAAGGGGARSGGDVLGPAGVAEDRAAAEVEDEDGNQDSRGGARGRPDARRGAPHPTVQIDPRRIPAFTGALELLDQGWASSLAPANGRALALLEGPVRLVGEAAAAVEALLIDPQTCGPLLATLPADRAGAALAALQRAGFPEAALIGRVLGAQERSPES